MTDAADQPTLQLEVRVSKFDKLTRDVDETELALAAARRALHAYQRTRGWYFLGLGAGIVLVVLALAGIVLAPFLSGVDLAFAPYVAGGAGLLTVFGFGVALTEQVDQFTLSTVTTTYTGDSVTYAVTLEDAVRRAETMHRRAIQRLNNHEVGDL